MYRDMVGLCSLVLWLSLVFTTTTTTSAFRSTTTNRVRLSSSITMINHRSQQQRGRSLLFSSTALTSPLQPVPEESSIIENNNSNNDVVDENDDMNEMKMSTTATTTGIRGDTKIQSTKRRQKLEYIQSEGGRLSFNTKYGALNPFAIYYGLTSILLGLPWFIALTCYQFIQFITMGRFDRLRRIPVHLNQLWGESLLELTRCFPEMIHRDILQKFYKEGRPAMFVANHNSWMDIPFLGASIGWKNYKLISKAELAKVPILGKAIKVGGHIMVSRDDPRSQIKTLKQGIQMLKDGVHLCTFPEGTRTRTGRLSKFKNGAFKMAHKAGAPVIPISIVGAEKVMPIHWMFPYRPARGIAKVVIHEPIESVGKTEEELADEVRDAIISGLPEDQRPLEGEE